jgi:hypothetical protein
MIGADASDRFVFILIDSPHGIVILRVVSFFMIGLVSGSSRRVASPSTLGAGS